MSGGQRLRTLTAGIVAGFAGGLFGVGGGILLVPILTTFFGVSQHRAHGTSLAAIGATALTGVLVYAWHGQVDWVWAAALAVTSVFAARLGARTAARTSRVGLLRAFAVFLVLVAVRMLWKAPAGSGIALAGVAAVASALAIGVIGGFLAGFLGVGGGIVMVPALVLLFGASQQVAQGTSLAVILAAAPAGAFVHDRHGNVARDLLPMLAVGAALGAPLSAQLAHRLPQAVLGRGFALFLIANAIQMWLRSLRGVRAASPA